MVDGTCDPASRGATYNVFLQGNNGVTIWGRYGWDGVSVRPDCDGPIIRLWARNDSDIPKFVWFQGRRGQWRSVEVPVGFDNSAGNGFTGAQLAARGLDSYADLTGLHITDDNVPPLA